ncbi:Putative salivary secreted protein [Gryllus bimaculatus]|nr:Putative salivary secreted protein [Gryllus bimaculatus]
MALSLCTTELDPNHVPDSVCVSMQPAHGPNEPKKSDPPYVVTVSSRKVSKGDTVRVVVKGLASETFKGIYIQGRINDLPVGRWLPHDNPQVRVLDCSPRKEDDNREIIRCFLDESEIDTPPSRLSNIIKFWKTVMNEERNVRLHSLNT